MNTVLMEKTKLAAYFIWEYTQWENALDLWYCAEDIGCHFEYCNILNIGDIIARKEKGIHDSAYVDLVQHIAFRVFIYTNNNDAKANWFNAEKLINNQEWCEAMAEVASIFQNSKTNDDFISCLRSDKVKNHYTEKNRI